MKLTKVSVLKTLVVVLLLINVTTIAGVWRFIDLKNMRLIYTAPQNTKDFIVAKLGLNAEQQQVLTQLRNEHFEQMGELKMRINNHKKQLSDAVKSNTPDTTQAFLHIAEYMRSEEQLHRLTMEHFRKIRAICNAEQQQHFDVIIDQITRMATQGAQYVSPEFSQSPNAVILP